MLSHRLQDVIVSVVTVQNAALYDSMKNRWSSKTDMSTGVLLYHFPSLAIATHVVVTVRARVKLKYIKVYLSEIQWCYPKPSLEEDRIPLEFPPLLAHRRI